MNKVLKLFSTITILALLFSPTSTYANNNEDAPVNDGRSQPNERNNTLPATSSFSDLDESTEQGKALKKLVQLGAMNGYPDGTMRPKNTIKREEVTKLLAHLTYKAPDTSSIYTHFEDVESTRWSAGYISFAYDMGYMNGVSPTHFHPDGTLTRGQMAMILYNFFYFDEPTITNPFQDVSPSSYFYKPILMLLENGITIGTTSTTFSPDAPVTREQFAVFLDRAGKLDELLKWDKEVDWSSIPTTWVNGGLNQLQALFDGRLSGYYQAQNATGSFVEIDFSYLGTSDEDLAFYVDNVANGTIVSIKHEQYNPYLLTVTDFYTLFEIENNLIKRFKIISPATLKAFYASATGLQALAKNSVQFIEDNGWKVIDAYDFNLYTGYTFFRNQLGAFIHDFGDLSYYIHFNDTRPTYLFHSLTDGSSYEVLKVKPVQKGELYDVSYNVATPTFTIELENKNIHPVGNIESVEGYNVAYEYNADNNRYTLYVFGDADTDAAVNLNETMTFQLYDYEFDFDESGNFLGYFVTIDYITYQYIGGKWVVVNEYRDFDYIEEYFDDDEWGF